MFNKAKKIEQWKRAGPLSCCPLYSHEFESHGRHSYKVFPHLNFWGCIFSCAFYLCGFFVLYFLVVLCFLLLFLLISFFIFNLSFSGNRQNVITMKFQDASCPPLTESVLSSSVEPTSQSLAVSVSSSLDVTAMTRRSTWSSRNLGGVVVKLLAL